MFFDNRVKFSNDENPVLGVVLSTSILVEKAAQGALRLVLEMLRTSFSVPGGIQGLHPKSK